MVMGIPCAAWALSEQRPHHCTHHKVDAVRGVGRTIGLGTPRVERGLITDLVWVVVQSFTALVLRDPV